MKIVGKLIGEVIGHAPCEVRFSEAERTVHDRAYYLECSEQRVLRLGLEAGVSPLTRGMH